MDSHWISQLGLRVCSKLSFIEENSGLFYVTWENCFFFREDAFYIVQACAFDYFSILSRSVPIFHISLSIIYQLYLIQIYILFLWDSCIRPIKKGLVVETSLDLLYILPYYVYLVHVIYYFYLNKINLFISIPDHKFMINKKKHISVVICVSWIMSCSDIFLSQDGVFQNSTGCKKNFLVTDHGGDLC